MKTILLSSAFLLINIVAAAQPQPELYTPQQIKEKFGVEVTDGNWAPVVKAIIDWMNDVAGKEEYNAVKVVDELKEMALRLPPPARNLVHYLVGDFYAKYWENNHWQINSRTSAPDAGGTLDTWDMNRLLTEAMKYYMLSVEDADALKAAALKDYKPVLITGSLNKLFDDEGDYSDRFFTTLYDILIFNIINELSNGMSVFMPNRDFTLDNPAFWAPVEEFTRMDIEAPELPSVEYEVLRLYQKLLAFRLERFARERNAENVLPLIAMDVERLKYVMEGTVYGDMDELYAAALGRVRDAYAAFAESEYANYQLALLFKGQGERWRFDRNERWRNKLSEAYALLDQVALRWKEFEALAWNVQKEIADSSVGVSLAKQQYPNQPFLVLGTHRNVENIYILIYKLKDESERERNDNPPGSDRWSWLSDREPVRDLKVEMPQYGDFQQRTAQFMIEGLPQGHYLMFASTKQFEWHSYEDTHYIQEIPFQVSPLALNIRNGNGRVFGMAEYAGRNLGQVYVTDAKTGKPEAGARIDAYGLDYDSPRDERGRYDEISIGSYRTGKDGMAYVPEPDNRRRFSKLVVTSADGGRLVYNDNLYIRFYEQDNENDTPRAVFFTDRAIYRPGQTVYFKALLIRAGKERNEIVPGKEITVRFKDMNYKEIEEQTLTTNEFGSVQGSFIIPQGLLNGYFRIECEWGNVVIHVEEYKRPTFEVEFDPVEKNYRFGDEVEAVGRAVALAGYSLDNSTVRYRVRRESNYRFTTRNIYMGAAGREISSGEVTTDADGRFTIPFTATAEGLKREKTTAANFLVTVDVTDVNGETRSASTMITVGDNPLVIDAAIPAAINGRDSLSFAVGTTNLNGRPVAAEVSVTVEALGGHARILRERLWDRPDTTLIARQVFENLFPHDIYADEDDAATFPVVRAVSDPPTVSTGEGSAAMVDLGVLRRQPAGWYRVTLRAVAGDGIETEKVYNLRLNGTPQGKQTPITNAREWITNIRTSGEPGEEAVFDVAGPGRNTFVRYDVVHQGRIVRSDAIRVGTTPQRITFPIEELHRGGFGVQFIMVADGRTYFNNVNVDVPFTDRKLDISFTTFRDRLLPGERERWTLTVKNRDGEKEMAEMVATLYDSSLDQFAPLSWPTDGLFFSRSYFPSIFWLNLSWSYLARGGSSGIFSVDPFYLPAVSINRFGAEYLALMRNDGRGNALPNVMIRGSAIADRSLAVTGSDAGETLSQDSLKNIVAGARNFDISDQRNVIAFKVAHVAESGVTYQDIRKFTAPIVETDEIATRQNFGETAFFYPQLRTDEDGEIIIEFTIPESLTRWNMLGFAHTKDLKAGSVKNSLITQKQVAVSANAPRFFREGDRVEFTAAVFNVTDENLSGEALLRLYDAATMRPVDGVLKTDATVAFGTAAGQSSGLRWTLEIPEGLSAITYKLTARAGTHTDGEERTVPVLSNTIMLTETQPFMVRAGESRTVDFARLREKTETVRRNHSLTLEFTSNPAWYAVLAMPYLMEFPYECSEQIFSRFYANSLSASITDKTPRIKRIFEQWRDASDTNALLSNLERNQELKQVLLEETPWVLQAQDETERKRRIGMLFDLNRLADQQRLSFDKLAKMQRGDGGFAWFDGLAPSRHITQHIIAGFGQLAHLGALNADFSDKIGEMTAKGFAYLDADLQRDHAAVKQAKDFDPKKQYINYIQLHYLYAASFGKHVPQNQAQREAFDFYYGQAKAHWRKFNLYGQGLAALAFHRYGDTTLAREVTAALKSASSRTEDMGMFWRANRRGYFWYEAPIETQALMIAVFDEAGGDPASVEELKIWLLRNKQTNSWHTTKATADACYALLMTGDKLLDDSDILDVSIGGRPLAEAASGGIRPEAGTGYVKTVWAGSDITPAMGTLEITNPNKSGVAWGGMFWQYFEKLDNVTSAETDLRMEKQIFIKRNTPRGVELTPIAEGSAVNVGDLLTVRVILRAHRDYEYVHLKDMRASGLEPVRTLSGYRRQDGLLYYENIKDASTNFFITTLSAGTYVFEYDLRVSHAGDFSNGVTTFQCMYAPEFSAHSGGTRLMVE